MNEEITLKNENGEWKTLATAKFSARKAYVSPDPEQITATIPGTITKIYVNEGDKVEKGSPLLEFEAMKMRNTIVSPHGGFVTTVHVLPGSKVNKGEKMVKIEKK